MAKEAGIVQAALYPDREKFPGGMRRSPTASILKALNLASTPDAGSKTCAGGPGSLGWERQDAATFAAWEVDFLKYDYCDAPEGLQSAIRLYSRMGRAG
jgi:alpha-galactosidase